MVEPTGRIADRRVLALLAVVVAGVLALDLVSALVPGLDAALASLPIIVGVLLGGTLLVLLGALRPR